MNITSNPTCPGNPDRPPPPLSLLRSNANWIIAPLVLAAALSIWMLDDWCRLMPDSFKYLLAARAIHETGGFPAERQIAPPGFPLMLAPIMGISDAPFLAIRIFLTVCFVAAVGIAGLLLRIEIGTKPALAAAILTATSGLMLTQSSTLLSETPYLPFALGSLLLAARWRRDGCPSAWQAALGGLLAVSATLIRSMGIVIAPMMALCLLLDKSQSMRRRLLQTAICTACFAAPLMLWQARQYSYPSAYDYGVQWTRARDIENSNASGLALQIQRLKTFGPLRLQDIKSAMIPAAIGWRCFDGIMNHPTTWTVGLLIVGTALYRLVKYRRVIDAYVVATLLMLALWPWDEGARLVVPLLPILWGYAAWLFFTLLKGAGNRVVLRSTVIFPAVLLACAQAGELWYVRKSLIVMGEKEKTRWSRAEDLARWQSDQLPNYSGILGVTSPGHNDKLVLAGASLLSRRPLLGYYEVSKSRAVPAGSERAEFIIVQEGLARLDLGLPLGSIVGRASGFEIFTSASRNAPMASRTSIEDDDSRN